MADIKVKVKADTEDARKKIAELGQTAEDGMNRGAQAAERFANAANKAANAAQKTAKATGEIAEGARISSRQIVHLSASFATMGVGLATKYAASRVDKDSNAGAALEYGGNILTNAGAYAAMGSVAGPWGTAIGAGVGAVKGAAETWIDRDDRARAAEEERKRQKEAEDKLIASNLDLVKSFNTMHAKTMEQKRLFEQLADASTPVADRMLLLKARSNELTKEIDSLQKDLHSAEVLKDPKKFAEKMKDLQSATAERDKLKDTAKGLQDKTGSEAKRFMESFDSLAKVGGFIGGDSVTALNRQQLDATKESVSVLKRIEAKTEKTKTSWS